MRCLIIVFLASLVSCSPQDRATLTLVTGGETDTFTQSPVPTKLQVDAVQGLADGGTQTSILASTSYPATSIDLGSETEAAEAVIAVSGFDDAGTQVLQGQSLLLDFSSIAGATIPIFVQRNGQFARLPGPLSDSRQMPTLGILQGQYLFVGGGTDPTLAATSQLYDFMQLAPLGSPPMLPTVPASIAFVGTVGWLIDSGGGTYFDFSDSYRGAIPLPPGGGTFADIAGGQTLADENGVQYIVGATRTTGAASSWVLKIDPNVTSNANYPLGNPSWLELDTSRLGAAAAWVTGVGLVVAGGSSMGPGAELFAANSSAMGLALPYAADSSIGAGATALDAQHVLLAGGIVAGADAGVRIIDLECASMCTPTTWPGLPTAIATAQAFSSNGANIILVGNEPALDGDGGASATSGNTHVYELAISGTTEIMTKVPHVDARAIGSPLGTLVLFGGAGEIESFVP